MARLFGLMITKDDDLIIEKWMLKHAGLFEKIAVVDGSTTHFTRDLCARIPNAIYRRDPDTHITDQTLRHEGWQGLKPFVSPGDWIFICHADEFYVHDPRFFLDQTGTGNVVIWLPLVVLPHPDEAAAWIKSSDKDPTSLFNHVWWPAGQDPHVEHRMWRYVKEPVWNLETKRPGCGVIPYNYWNEKINNTVPIYLHYRCFDLNINAYHSDDGSYKKSAWNQGVIEPNAEKAGLGRPIQSFADFFFHEERPPEGSNQICLKFGENALELLGNPPRLVWDHQLGKVKLINKRGDELSKLFTFQQA